MKVKIRTEDDKLIEEQGGTTTFSQFNPTDSEAQLNEEDSVLSCMLNQVLGIKSDFSTDPEANKVVKTMLNLANLAALKCTVKSREKKPYGAVLADEDVLSDLQQMTEAYYVKFKDSLKKVGINTKEEAWNTVKNYLYESDKQTPSKHFPTHVNVWGNNQQGNKQPYENLWDGCDFDQGTIIKNYLDKNFY